MRVLSSGALSFQVKLLKICGIYVQSTPKYGNIHSTLMILNAIVGTFLVAVEYFFQTELAVKVYVITIGGCYLLILLKLLTFYYARKQIGEIILAYEDIVETNRFNYEDEVTVKKYTKKIRVQVVGYGISVFIVLGYAYLTSIYTRLTAPPEGWVMPFTPVTFVNVTYSPRYEIAMHLQYFSGSMVGYTSYAVDVTVIEIFGQLVLRFKLLQNSLRKLIKKKRQIKSRRIFLREHIKKHIDLLELGQKIEDTISIYFLCVLVMNGSIICFLMFCTTMVSPTSADGLYYIQCLVIIFSQILMYCSWGESLTESSSEVAGIIYEIYESENWKEAKDLTIILRRSQKPLYVTAGKFFPMSHETFAKLMRSVLSYYTVLKRMNERSVSRTENVHIIYRVLCIKNRC